MIKSNKLLAFAFRDAVEDEDDDSVDWEEYLARIRSTIARRRSFRATSSTLSRCTRMGGRVVEASSNSRGRRSSEDEIATKFCHLSLDPLA